MLKIRYIWMLMLYVLMPVTVAFAETVTSTAGHHDQDIKDGKVVLKDAANRATFTLSGMDIKYKTRFGALQLDAYDLGSVGWNSSKYVTLSWDVDPDYTIVVTNISFGYVHTHPVSQERMTEKWSLTEIPKPLVLYGFLKKIITGQNFPNQKQEALRVGYR